MGPPTGPLEGVTVVELASEWGAYAGKLLADLGARVILVEPPGGHPTRGFGPFAGDQPGPERSLWFWYYNTAKLGVTLDLDSGAGRNRLRALLLDSDVLLEAELPGRVEELGIDYRQLRQEAPGLIVVSVMPFSRRGPRSAEQATDLTILAGGGPVWSCGYDDHALPPVRPGFNHASHIAGHFAVIGLLVALLHRESGGPGQHVEVDMNAAANVTTELASYGWLAAQVGVERQTGRHASPVPTQATQVLCADGRWLNTGVPPRKPAEFAALRAWLEELGLAEAFPLAPLLEMGASYESVSAAQVAEDPLLGEIFGAGREAMALIASRLTAHEAFVGFQRRGLPAGVVYSPDEAIKDSHFVERGFPVHVLHEEVGREVIYPGAPYRFARTPWRTGRAPRLGEHNREVLGGAAGGEGQLP